LAEVNKRSCGSGVYSCLRLLRGVGWKSGLSVDVGGLSGRYKQGNGRERWQTLRAVGGVDPVTTTTVFGLLPDTRYQFMVLARNRLGDGLFSNVVAATTSGAPGSSVLPGVSPYRV